MSSTKSLSRTKVDQENKNEYIENLKKQIYLMENDIHGIKDRELQIEKSGGFSKILKFNFRTNF
jgi:hypothetical protein